MQQNFDVQYLAEFPLGRPRRRWENNIKMVLREIGCGMGGG
jgi:hypothetical protein